MEIRIVKRFRDEYTKRELSGWMEEWGDREESGEGAAVKNGCFNGEDVR